MKRISEVLKLAIVIERGRVPSVPKAQLFEKLDFVCCRVSAQRTIPEKCPQAWHRHRSRSVLHLAKFEPLLACRSNSAIQEDVQAEGPKIDVPRYNQRIQERDAAFGRYVKNICIQKFENGDAHLFITSVALPGYCSEPIFASQFLSDHRLYHIQEFLSDQPFQLAERFFLENGTHLGSLRNFAFFKK